VEQLAATLVEAMRIVKAVQDEPSASASDRLGSVVQTAEVSVQIPVEVILTVKIVQAAIPLVEDSALPVCVDQKQVEHHVQAIDNVHKTISAQAELVFQTPLQPVAKAMPIVNKVNLVRPVFVSPILRHLVEAIQIARVEKSVKTVSAQRKLAVGVMQTAPLDRLVITVNAPAERKPVHEVANKTLIVRTVQAEPSVGKSQALESAQGSRVKFPSSPQFFPSSYCLS